MSDGELFRKLKIKYSRWYKVAEAYGCDPSFIARIRNGSDNLSPNVRKKLVSLLGNDYWELPTYKTHNTMGLPQELLHYEVKL